MTRTLISAVLAAAFLLGGCGKTAEQKKIEDLARQAEEAGKALQQGTQGLSDAMKGMGEAANGGKAVEPVEFRELKALLPEKIGALTREGAEGEKASAIGVKVSEAHADYVGTEPGRVTVKITDMGSVSGYVGMAAAAWAFADVDRETETGYEKTTTFGPYKAYEKYDNDSHTGTLNILVEKRFVVTIDGADVDMATMKAAAGAIDLGKLASMKNVGVTS